jgi:hypothetical protein
VAWGRAAKPIPGAAPNLLIARPTIKKKEEVYERINELLLERQGAVLKKTAKDAEYTRDTLLGYLEEARAIALDKSNAVAVVSATIGMARILGLIIDRREVGDVGAFDGLTDEELIREARRRSRELGLDGSTPNAGIDCRFHD